MESSLWLFLVLITLAIIHIVQAQDPQGFISLDCGLPANELSPYKDVSTGLQFFSDATYIQSGKTGRVQANLETKYTKQCRTLRYFPVGIRNCYNLNVKKGKNHLIRAKFVYGNYDGLNNSPKFDMYLGPSPWATIDLAGQGNGSVEEIIHVPTSSSLQICLVKTGMTTPVISALEIRLMRDGTYITQSSSLRLYFRKHLSESANNIRYPDDAYDRLWTPYFQKEWTQISATSDVSNSNLYDLPKKAVATAAIPTNAYEPLEIEWTNSNNSTAQYYLYVHFAEIQELGANDTREFNMVWNGQVMSSDPIIPKKCSIYTIFSKPPRTCQGGKCSFQLMRTSRSTLPPLLNAIEVYTLIQFPQAETDESDVDAMKNIATTYGLSRINWQGDPCFPLRLRWDGLNCSNTNISTPPKITSLNLSSRGLTGNIAAAIQNLTQLQKLDLSNNNLTGGLPEFLGNMKSLSVINLSGNNLNGSIPRALQKKGLQLLVEGNPKLGHSDSRRKSRKKKVLLPTVASVASAAIVTAVLVSVLKMIKKSTVQQEVRTDPAHGVDQVTGCVDDLWRGRSSCNSFSVERIRRALYSSPARSSARSGRHDARSSPYLSKSRAQTSSQRSDFRQEAFSCVGPSGSSKKGKEATNFDEMVVLGSDSPTIVHQLGEGESSSKRARVASDHRREKFSACESVPSSPSSKDIIVPRAPDSLDVLRDLIIPHDLQIPSISSLREEGIFREVISALGQVVKTTTRMVGRYEGHCDEISPPSSLEEDRRAIKELATSFKQLSEREGKREAEVLALRGELSIATAKLTSVMKKNVRLEKDKRGLALAGEGEVNHVVDNLGVPDFPASATGSDPSGSYMGFGSRSTERDDDIA